MFMSKLLNEIVGDAIADLFAVELSLRLFLFHIALTIRVLL